MDLRKTWLAALLFVGALTACQPQTTGGPKPQTALVTAKEAFAGASATSLFEVLDSEAIEFVKVRYGIPRGTPVGVSKALMARCWGRGVYEDLTLRSDPRWSREKDLAEAFFDAASGAGLDIVGDPRRLFDEREERSRATMAVGAEIVGLNLDVCDEVNWLDKRIGKMSGSGEIEVAWQVYDRIKRKVIQTTRTRGRAQLADLPPDEISLIVTEAFRDAARVLTQDAGFRKTIAKRRSGENSSADSSRLPIGSLNLMRIAVFAGPLERRAGHLQHATVTIDLSDAHGSGFIVDPRGYILTNQHVVGERELVRVRFLDGKEAIGEVLRRDRVRDVALVKIAEGDHPALPIRHAPAAVAEEVYAIGAPLDPSLSNSVTKGVVSAIRSGKRNGLLYIQADVNIQGGNSGGPLVDRSGNVVGISVAGIREEGVMTGINFFIPIRDALDRLNLKLADEPTS